MSLESACKGVIVPKWNGVIPTRHALVYIVSESDEFAG